MSDLRCPECGERVTEQRDQPGVLRDDAPPVLEPCGHIYEPFDPSTDAGGCLETVAVMNKIRGESDEGCC